MRTVAFHPEGNNPHIDLTIDEGNTVFEETVDLRLAYGRVEGESQFEQIYVVQDSLYFHEHLMGKLQEIEAQSDVRIEPASQVEVKHWM